MDPELFATAGKILLKALPFIIAGAVGFGAAESYEHKAPWGLAHQLARERADAPGKAAADRDSIGAWSASLEACRTGLTAARDAAADAQSRADAQISHQASAAYRLGRATCGGTSHATTDAPAAAGAPAAGGVRDDDDFARLVGGGAVAAAP